LQAHDGKIVATQEKTSVSVIQALIKVLAIATLILPLLACLGALLYHRLNKIEIRYTKEQQKAFCKENASAGSRKIDSAELEALVYLQNENQFNLELTTAIIDFLKTSEGKNFLLGRNGDNQRDLILYGQKDPSGEFFQKMREHNLLDSRNEEILVLMEGIRTGNLSTYFQRYGSST
jgi:hypothetical protein